MKDKKRIVIRFETDREYFAMQESIELFKKQKRIRNKNEAYLKLLKLGLDFKVDSVNETEQITLDELRKLLTLTEAQIRLLFWVIISNTKPTLEEIKKLDITSLPLLESLKRLI